MKLLHRPGLYAWSRFDEARNIDFHSYLVCQPEGNVIVDPLPMSDHDRAHLHELGGADWVVVTNSDHARAARSLAQAVGAPIAGPAAEKASFPIDCARWLEDGNTLAGGIEVVALDGSKTPGELALLVDGHTLITGDLIRAHRGGGLDLLPAHKLADPASARASVERLIGLDGLEAVLPGDGWPVFRDGQARLQELFASL
ncbi:MAG: MBL fold metallo-hydrolase [Polyangiaceae bacterium]